MNISQASKRSSISAKAIRYYESISLIPPANRLANGYRDYAENDVSTLQFIQRARNLGFAIKDVESLVALWQDRNRASADVKKLATDHIAQIEDRISELQSVRDVLANLSENCHGDDRPECPILKGLEQS
ncbi:MAG: Cu(I)-responsive transcriptional regulator [Rhodospirillales bacterium]|jgi:Cu(I)-responsive transcriptional regulator|nr:Cu(I)-responsive transcriptional regulator [Rhodospirillales bacterium]MBT4038806.1 Cu(I)-responsive transcriptional regulator [Rhodospirillales bacterium]MBT4625097.1 Cu(I)-responsive transcriptional regulator [Rhodospirillales bacterium]MBT5352968.1 Cu(I)-responsive transcriptional regulator [Rhodospirillales bacterium]MBT5519723.1 Cu(I)-responsive transcriptional regulator [Rhodospirillales bacterium]